MIQNGLLSLIIGSPLIGMVVLFLMPRQKQRWIKATGIAATMLPLLLTLYMFGLFDYQVETMQFVEKRTWAVVPVGQEAELPLNYHLGVDGVSMALLVLTTVIGTLTALASVRMHKRWKEYFVLLLFLEIGALGVFAAQNLLWFFIFFEIALVATFFLISVWGSTDREKAAFKFLLYNGLGSALLLIATVLLLVHVWTLDMVEITRLFHDPTSSLNTEGSAMYVSDSLRGVLFLLMFLAFAVKLPVVPLHSWIMKMYEEAPVPVVMISSGVLLKIGAYGMLRINFGFFPGIAETVAFWIALFGLINLIYGALLALVQTDLKRVLAYSSVSHMGIVLFGLASLNAYGFQGAVYQMVSHGLIAALLFYVVGLIAARTGTTRISELGGLAHSMPFIGGVFLTAALASLGLPGMSGFVSEFLAYLGLFHTEPVIAALGTVGLVLTAAYLLRAVLGTLFGKQRARVPAGADANFSEAIPLIVLLGMVLLIGIYPAILGEPLQMTIQNMVAELGGGSR